MPTRIPPFINDLVAQSRTRQVPVRLAPVKGGGKRAPKFIKGVYNGTYFRYKIPKQKPPLFKIPQLPTSHQIPKSFKSIPAPKHLPPPPLADQLKAWWKENWAVFILNFGSVCTLMGFTRSDVVELRTLSMTGSLSSVVYNWNQKPFRLAPIAWSCLFATVNAYKITQIMHERNAVVVLDDHNQQVFHNFFLPHGLTPKQYEILMKKATLLRYKRGDPILRQGETMQYIFLVAKGGTRASILGRHLTAASAIESDKEERIGRHSGAWIGEMAFLEYCWEKEQRKKVTPSEEVTPKPNKGETADPAPASSETPAARPRKKKVIQAMYSVVATSDCEVYRWTYDDMEALMGRSVDMRGALTRAMTSAIVGKVVNFTVSKKSALPTWSTWLDDIRFKGGATYLVSSEPEEGDASEDSDPSDGDQKEKNPDAVAALVEKAGREYR